MCSKRHHLKSITMDARKCASHNYQSNALVKKQLHPRLRTNMPLCALLTRTWYFIVDQSEQCWDLSPFSVHWVVSYYSKRADDTHHSCSTKWYISHSDDTLWGRVGSAHDPTWRGPWEQLLSNRKSVRHLTSEGAWRCQTSWPNNLDINAWHRPIMQLSCCSFEMGCLADMNYQ